MTIRQSKFYKNEGLMEGGAIAWLGKSPNIEKNNYYSMNKAVYGNNISSYAIKLQIEIFERKEGQNIFSSKINDSIVMLKDVSSGNLLPYQINVFVTDVYDQIVETARGLIKIKGGILNLFFKRKIEIKCNEGALIIGDPLKIIEKGKIFFICKIRTI